VKYLDPTGSQLGHKESIRDTGRVLGRMYDGIQYRSFGQAGLEELAAAAGVPVWNGLTDQWHPTQALCDMLTMREHTEKPDEQVAFAYCGDARNNVGNSLLVAGALMGMDVRMVAPMSLQNHDDVVEAAQAVAMQIGARLLQSDDVAEGVSGVDFVYTPTIGTPPQFSRFWQTGLDCTRGDRRGVRVDAIDRLRPGREPDAHHQGHHGRDIGTLDARRGRARR
jgi:ornithine carbamoyltransferase